MDGLWELNLGLDIYFLVRKRPSLLVCLLCTQAVGGSQEVNINRHPEATGTTVTTTESGSRQQNTSRHSPHTYLMCASHSLTLT